MRRRNSLVLSLQGDEGIEDQIFLPFSFSDLAMYFFNLKNEILICGSNSEITAFTYPEHWTDTCATRKESPVTPADARTQFSQLKLLQRCTLRHELHVTTPLLFSLFFHYASLTELQQLRNITENFV